MYTISLTEYSLLSSLLNKHCTKHKDYHTIEQPAWGDHIPLPSPDDNPPEQCVQRVTEND